MITLSGPRRFFNGSVKWLSFASTPHWYFSWMAVDSSQPFSYFGSIVGREGVQYKKRQSALIVWPQYFFDLSDHGVFSHPYLLIKSGASVSFTFLFHFKIVMISRNLWKVLTDRTAVKCFFSPSVIASEMSFSPFW